MPVDEADGPAVGWGKYLFVALFAAGLFGAVILFSVSNQDLFELTAARERDLPAIRTAMLLYKEKNGQFPAQLEDLEPDYIPKLPESLVNRPEMKPVQRLRYRTADGTAIASFHRHRGPDSNADFDFESGEFHYNE